MNTTEKLTGKQFYTVSELAEILGCSCKTSRIKFTQLAQRENRKVQIKTFLLDGSVNVKYRMSSSKPYSPGYDCCDASQKSKITWSELNQHGAKLGNTNYDLLCNLYELRDKYYTITKLSDLIGIKHISRAIKNLEQSGFIFHRRNNKDNREIKLIGFKPKKGSIKVNTEQPSNLKLINEVFR
ncbi:hypothetical protein vBVnaSL3_17 [Vibrio phage vB_VnaS-L3]|nr:hypothetical protein vBVnaSL3_17 [Vibrio phage vB_VnaS-L3]